MSVENKVEQLSILVEEDLVGSGKGPHEPYIPPVSGDDALNGTGTPHTSENDDDLE